MEKYEQGVMAILSGIFFALIGFRVIKTYKNDIVAADAFHKKYGTWFKVLGFSSIGYGVASLLGKFSLNRILPLSLSAQPIKWRGFF